MRHASRATVLALLLACACAPSARHARLAVSDRAGAADSAPSLFRSDADVLSDSAIRRILDYRFSVAGRSRMATLQVGERSVRDDGWLRDSRLPATVTERLTGALRASGRVREAAPLPALLVPRQRTVGHLREAAARFQADLLLVYQTDCRSFERYRVFAPSEVRATCAVEAVLIDTRTGLVPFTAAAARQWSAKKAKEEKNFDETVQRVEWETVGDALEEVGRKTAAYLEGTAP